MEHVLHFVTDVRFEYCDRTPTVMNATLRLEREQTQAARVEWVKLACALVQTRKHPQSELYSWTRLANSFMAADKVSVYADQYNPSRLLLHKKAAKRYRDQAASLELRVMSIENEAYERTRDVRRRRFPHH